MNMERVIDRITHATFEWIDRRFSVVLVFLILLNLVAMVRLMAFNSLHVYAATNDVAGINRMICLGADVNAREHARYSGYTPLHMAALFDSAEAADALIRAGASINARNTAFLRTPLYIAVLEGHVRTQALLLQRGADPSIPDVYGVTIEADLGLPASAVP